MWRDFVHLFLPHYCLLCKTLLVNGETLVCTVCFDTLPQTTYHQEPDNIVSRKLAGKLPIRYAMALYKFRKSGKVQQLLYHLKYKHRPVIGKILGRRYGSLLRASNLGQIFDLIIPVPLHSSRYRQRGYNQSNFFAQGLSDALNIPWGRQYLIRTKRTATQTKRGKMARFRSMEDAFKAINTTGIRHKHILLVDDIITTGATLEACGLVLLAAGVKELSVATIAVAE